MDRKQANDIEELQKEKAVSAQGGGTFAPPLFGRGAKNRRGARFGPGFASAVAYRFRARSAPRRVTAGRCRRWCPPRFRTGAAPWRS